MSSLSNPYTPTPVHPRVLVGRAPEILHRFEARLAAAVDQVRGTLLLGPRGTGKSALLDEFVKSAASRDWVTSLERLKPGLNNESDFAGSFIRSAKRVRYDISTKDKMLERAKSLARVLEYQFPTPEGGSIAVRLPGSDETLTIEEAFVETLTGIGQVLRTSGRFSGAVFIFDEAQYLFDRPEQGSHALSALTNAFSTVQREFPVMLVLAGLPSVRPLIATAQPNAPRAFETEELTALSLDPPSGGLSEAAAAVAEIAAVGCFGYAGSAAQFVAVDADGYLAGIHSIGHALIDHANVDGVTTIDDDYYHRHRAHLLDHLDRELYLGEYERATIPQRQLLKAAARATPPFSLDDISPGLPQPAQTLDELREANLVYEARVDRYDFSYGGFGAFLRRHSS